ncbi:uncharacterized protein CLUP02_01344 [Colletotrichum lupini]|uniref:Uncharacterized protein n=1 Tax=Colletotrichum lupini TaxID=145971 RepID=A0A9Q8W9L4_9PEZI|nr:uncharacterized protein CLUP02_01344 [Colletotrichum lupini]UQC74692.1 hypothetical protein CLUP02_01344 [Colletotrichum lupini]
MRAAVCTEGRSGLATWVVKSGNNFSPLFRSVPLFEVAHPDSQKEGREAVIIGFFTLVYQANAIGILSLDARQYFRFFKWTLAGLHPNGTAFLFMIILLHGSDSSDAFLLFRPCQACHGARLLGRSPITCDPFVIPLVL